MISNHRRQPVEYPAALVLLLTESLLPWANPTGSHRRSRRPPAPGGCQAVYYLELVEKPPVISTKAFIYCCTARIQRVALLKRSYTGFLPQFYEEHRPSPPATAKLFNCTFRADTYYLSPIYLHMLSISSVCNTLT